MASEHQAAGSIAIEPMGERRRTRQAKAQRAEIILQALAALRPLMHGKARRLVDDQHQGIAVEQAAQYLFLSHGGTGITAPGMSDSTNQGKEGATTKRSWWQRLTGGLKATSSSLGGAIADLVTKRKLDADMLEEIEEVLIRADLGVETAGRIAAVLGEGRFDKTISADEVKSVLAAEVEKILTPVAKPLVLGAAKPFVILVVGVNGSGKTTTIGKLAAKFRTEGKKVMLAAGDTFRAAAVEQLKIWGERVGASVIAREAGADSAGVAFEALEAAKKDGADILIVDTAGRLQNKAVLMEELEKIVRVVKKLDASAPHAVLLVLDATVGQNAISQVEVFLKVAGVTGLAMTKLDGTARGGILVALAQKFALPIHFIGLGEGVDDLAPFAAKDFARAIAGIE
jgi:fused signal recognition particle receptor